ncbi:hypothetical protein GW846_01355 [Candidatus Gracilibacteria bacterium]|nr:hypothetical protein [Candidatus Gracilibacteria bacterium]
MNSKDLQDLALLQSIVDSVIQSYNDSVKSIKTSFDTILIGLKESNEKILLDYSSSDYITDIEIGILRKKLEEDYLKRVEEINGERKRMLDVTFQDSSTLIMTLKKDYLNSGVSKEVLDSVHGFSAQVIELFPDKK